MSDKPYELSVVDQRKNAVRLARSAIEKACSDSARAKQLAELEDVPCTTLMQEIYKAAGLELVSIATSAEIVHTDQAGNVERAPNYPARLKALEILADQRIREGELLIKMGEAQQGSDAKGGGSMRSVRAVVMTEAEVRRMEEMTRADSAKTG